MLLKLFTIKYILQVLLQNCWGQLSKLEYVYVSSKDYVTSAIFRYSCSPSSFSMWLHDHLLLFTEIRRLLFPLRKYYHYPLNAFFSHVPPDPPLTSTYVEVFEIKIIFLCRINDHHTFLNWSSWCKKAVHRSVFCLWWEHWTSTLCTLGSIDVSSSGVKMLCLVS